MQANADLVAVSPSRWLAEVALSGLWRGHRVEVIPNGLPLDVFKPVDRSVARRALGVPEGAPVLLVAASDFLERRKGAAILNEALRLMKSRPLVCMIMGARAPHMECAGVQFVDLGFVSHDRMKVLAFSAADIFVHPALEDNLPNTVVESLACGTPVAGFSTGGMPEMVRGGETGWLAGEISAQGLATMLETALAEVATGRHLRESSRAVAEAEYSLEMQARRYAALFEEVARGPARSA
jgi:glycosyltransferase involved in cell wall biosynthesis